MSSTDGVNKVPGFASGAHQDSVRSEDAKDFRKTAEDYVKIENRLAAQREQPKPSAQLNSIFDQLRGHLPK